MKKFSIKYYILFTLFFIVSIGLYSEDAVKKINPISLREELLNSLKKETNIDSKVKILDRLYKLEIVSGLIADGALHLQEIIDFKKNTNVSNYLLTQVSIFLKLGELDKANQVLSGILLKETDIVIISRARLLMAYLNLLNNDTKDIATICDAILLNNSCIEIFPEALLLKYFVQDESSKVLIINRLQKDFQQNPITQYLVSKSTDKNTVTLYPDLFYFTLSGVFDSKVATDNFTEAPVVIQEKEKVEDTQVQASATATKTSYLKIGSFIKEANAVSLVEELKKKNFLAEVQKRTVKDILYYSVFVKVRKTIDEERMLLKDSGYESSPE